MITVAISDRSNFCYCDLSIRNRRKYFKRYGTNINSTTSNLILLLIISVSFLLQRVQTEITNVKYNKKFINVSFSIDYKTIKSDSTHYYIGNTKSYLFYYKAEFIENNNIPNV